MRILAGSGCLVALIVLGYFWKSEPRPKATPVTTAPAPATPNRFEELKTVVTRLEPLQTSMPETQPGDWLASHKEVGQSFAKYVKRHPSAAPKKLTTLYIQPIGEFDSTRQKLVATTARCLEVFYGRPVKTLPTLGLDTIPEHARREGGGVGRMQLLTGYILNEVLKPNRPKDALAVLALSAEDLWPGEGWNYVFGQASLSERVGVWSIRRFGHPELSPEDYHLCLLRTLGTATHETGHMLGIQHCIAAQCGMNGSNSLEESDRGPLHFCAECQAKVWWYCNLQPRQHLDKLIKFAEAEKLDDTAKYWKKCRYALDESR